MRKQITSKQTINKPQLKRSQVPKMLADPFAARQQFYKDEKQSKEFENNQSQETDIEIDDLPRQNVESKPLNKYKTYEKFQRVNTVEADVEIDTDFLSVRQQGQGQDIDTDYLTDRQQGQGLEGNFNLSFDKSEKNCHAVNKREIRMDSRKINRTKIEFADNKFQSKESRGQRAQSKKNEKMNKAQTAKPLKIQRKINQIGTNLQKLCYPQNVMKRVHAISGNKKPKTINTKLLKLREQNKSGAQNEKNICPTKNKLQRQKMQQSKEVKEDNFLDNRPKYDKVEMADAQVNTILQNMIWIGRVSVRDYIKSAFSEENLQIQQFQQNNIQKEKFDKSRLELKCMMRYRSLGQIILQANQLAVFYNEHNSYIVDPEDYFKPSSLAGYEDLRQQNMSICDCNKKIIQKLTQLLLHYAMELPFASQQNKMMAKQLYEKNGFVVNRFIVKGGTKISIQRSSDYNKHRFRKLFDSQGLFEPYKHIKSEFQHVETQQNILEREQLVEPQDAKIDSKIMKKITKVHDAYQEIMKVQDAYQDVEIDGPTKYENQVEKDYQI